MPPEYILAVIVVVAATLVILAIVRPDVALSLLRVVETALVRLLRAQKARREKRQEETH